MRAWIRFIKRFLNFSTARRGGERLREEMESHIAMQTEENIRSGMSPAEARREAVLKLGAVQAVREEYHAEEILPGIENLLHDLRLAFRSLRRTPGFTTTAVLTLMVGIGGVTAIFSIVYAVLLRPLPYPQPNRLIVLHEGMQRVFAEGNLSPPDIPVYQHENKAFTGVAGFVGARYEVAGAGAPFRAEAERVSASMFPILGVQPLVGRTFTQREDDNMAPVTVISDALWKNRFQSSRAVIGETIDLDRRPYTIIGVMPQTFETPSGPVGIANHDLWVPLSLTPVEKGEAGINYDYGAVARLRSGITMPQAQEDVQRVLKLIQAKTPGVKLSIAMRSLKEETVRDARPLLRILLGAVALILLIACANLANLLLVRAAGRRREFGMRLALGAKRHAILRQLLTESLLLSAMGGVLGVALTVALVDTATTWLPTLAPELPRVDEIAVRWPVVGLALVLILTTGVLCGLAPALASMKAEVMDSLRQGGQGTGQSKSQHRLRAVLVIAETALAMLLLVGSGLLLRSFVRMLKVDPGFQPEHVMTASLALPVESYSTQEKVDEFLRDLQGKTEAMPGVRAVGFSSNIPVTVGHSSVLFTAQDYVRKPNEGFSFAPNYLVRGSYFRALQIPLVEGRYFDAADEQSGAPLVAIVSQSFAKRYFAGHDPIGMGIKIGPNYSNPMPVMRVVGVVGDVSDNPLDEKRDVEMYEPVSQAAADWGPMGKMMGVVGSLHVVARTASDPKGLEAEFANAVRQADPLLAITDMKTMDEVLAGTQASRRFSTGVLTAFAAIALLLALLGIYGVLAYMVTERTREIAIRMAMGATRADVLGRTLKQALTLGVTGIVVGLAASAALTQFIRGLLYGVRPLDTVAIAGAVVALLLCIGLAGWLPARRAAAIDPMEALRSE